MTSAAADSASRLVAGNWPEQVPQKLGVLLADAAIIDAIEKQPAAALKQWQQAQLSRLLGFLKQKSPWWKTRFSAAERTQRFSDIPVLSREDFRTFNETEAKDLVLPPAHGRRMLHATSGSSGIPLRYFTTDLHQRMMGAYNFHNGRHQGRDLRGSMAVILTRVKEHPGEHVETRAYPMLGSGRMFQRRLPQFTVEAHARWVTHVAPTYLCISSTTLDGMLRTYEAGLAAAKRIEQVYTLSETVTPELRKRTRAILGASIRDSYSCEEIGPIAFQCPSSDEHYHVAVANTRVDVLDDEGKPQSEGKVGRVIVTGLHNWASPAIRYELNDLAGLLPRCPCGFAHHTLVNLLGRKRFLLRLPSGEHMVCNVQGPDWVPIAPFRETRLVQIAHDKIVAEVVLERAITDREREAVVRMLSSLISPDLTYKVQQVDKIAWAPTYKRQEFISLL